MGDLGRLDDAFHLEVRAARERGVTTLLERLGEALD
jgi:hypothetical protein